MRNLLLVLVACDGVDRPDVVGSSDDLDALQEEVEALSAELIEVRSELDALKNEQDSQGSAVGLLTDGQAELESDLETVEDAHGELLQALNETVVTLVSETQGVGDLLGYVTTDTTNHTIKFIGANLYIQSGSGYTDDGYHLKLPDWATYGLGNLIVGYDEDDGDDDKTGSHNIVVGRDHSYPSYGGLVVGYNNTISGQFSSVTGGHSNSAEARTASVSGGRYNRAANYYSWVGGGFENLADEWFASVMGGAYNASTGECGNLVGGTSLSDSTDLCDETP